MISSKDLLSFAFYQKEKFTGSFCGMRYLIQKSAENDGEIFEVFTWPGPYNFASTDESKKTRKTYPFLPDSLEEIAGYLNDTYQSGKDAWPKGISL